MARVNALVITGYGTNCENESAYALKAAGAESADIVYFSDLAAGHVRMDKYNYLLCPGGFLDGDDLGAAQAAALRWRWSKTTDGTPVLDQLKGFFTPEESFSASATASSCFANSACFLPSARNISNVKFPCLIMIQVDSRIAGSR